MLRKLVCAFAVIAMAVGLATAEEFRANIKKIEGGKVYFTKFARPATKGEKPKGEDGSLPLADSVKVVKAKFNQDTKKIEVGDAVSEGLKAEAFQKIGERGLSVRIVTDADNKKVTEIQLLPERKKKDTN
jgi:hypothetical protein